MSPRCALVVEDEPALAAGALLLLRSAGWSCRSARGVVEALAILRATPPAVTLVDLGLRDGDGIDVVRACAAASPPVPSVVWTVATAWVRVEAALRAGAAGYLLKDDAAQGLVPALEAALAGGSPLSPRVARQVVARTVGSARPAARTAATLAPLTPREAEVLALLASGASYDDIAAALAVSCNTVRSHIRALYDKLQAHNRTVALRHAAERGLLPD